MTDQNYQGNVLDRPALDQKASDQKAADKVAADKAKAPKTANEVLARVDEDHNYKHDPIDMNSTGGIQKATERNWKAIQALADFVDGKRPKQAV